VVFLVFVYGLILVYFFVEQRKMLYLPEGNVPVAAELHAHGLQLWPVESGNGYLGLLPVEEQTRKSGGKLDFRNAAGLGKELWLQVDVDEYLRKERQEWD